MFATSRSTIRATITWLTILAGGGLFLALAGRDTPRPELQAGTAPNGPKKYALLVGCTRYQHPKVPELYGPANDVPLFASLLKASFGFADAQVTQLVGWPDDPAKRPTYANICKAFEALVAKAGPGVQIAILMSGHGVQVPIPATQTDPLDPKNPEPDGMDEVFLPADVKSFTKDGLVNAIRDDQFGVWLDRMRDKGASVWIVFDCCHAGDMSRGDDAERPRFVHPQALGVTDEQIADARKRAEAAVGKMQAEARSPLTRSAAEKKGSVVAFYAAQSFQTAPELPRPDNAPRTKDHYFGLLSYTLTSVLKQQHAALSYRDLARLLVARYDQERGGHAPTPYFEGDLDREVLGTGELPAADNVLRRDKQTLWVNAGQLRGLTPGSVLSVHTPVGQPGDRLLGHVKVVQATPERAEVVPCAGSKGEFPELARCKLAVRDLGEMRVKVSVRPASAADEAGAMKVRTALKAMDRDVRDLVVVTDDDTAADWVLWVEKGKLSYRSSASKPALRYCSYDVNMDELPLALERDLRATYTWRNVWRIAGMVASTDAPKGRGLRVEVVKLKGKAQPDGSIAAGSVVSPPEDEFVRVRLEITNDGPQPVWLSVFYLDGRMGIAPIKQATALKGNGDHFELAGKIKGNTAGKEGFVVLAVPQEQSRERPDFSFLEQDGLGGKIRFDRERAAEVAPPTPFGRLMKAAALGQRERGYEVEEPTNPTIYSLSWITAPAPAKGP